MLSAVHQPAACSLPSAQSKKLKAAPVVLMEPVMAPANYLAQRLHHAAWQPSQLLP